jgi:molybdenum cofactor cytidylyltransferase
MIAAVLLAAGGSSRLGRPKQSLRYQGCSLLRRAAEAALEGGCGRAVVVLGAEADQLRPELEGLSVTAVLNERWNDGMAGSIRAGVEEALRGSDSPDALLLLLCDQPHLSAGVVRRVLDAFDRRPGRCVACEYEETVGPPALFERSWFDALLRLEGDQGAKRILRDAGEALVRVPWPEGAVDIDHPDDLDTYL